MNATRRLWCALALGLAAAGTARHVSAATEPAFRPFAAGSVRRLRDAYRGRRFVLAFWSVHCAPCLEDMALWSALRTRYPHVPLVLVTSDSPEDMPRLQAVVRQHGLAAADHWIFGDEAPERVRYAVDRSWRGELPRTYFFDEVGGVHGTSGRIDPIWAADWFARTPTPPR